METFPHALNNLFFFFRLSEITLAHDDVEVINRCCEEESSVFQHNCRETSLIVLDTVFTYPFQLWNPAVHIEHNLTCSLIITDRLYRKKIRIN